MEHLADDSFEPSNSLNPFEFRAGLERAVPKLTRQRKLGLNPFEFRAGLERKDDLGPVAAIGLNPFEFRAGLEHTNNAYFDLADYVLIPLNSGLAWSPGIP